ncbi:hypothetical protein PDE_00896 [Penicillium oxalicum 114-2]|uniref:Uncharacterized protein n=1 Tax=Penicillium oxalicum (strain 114-2 / CGMCC 5302) TaxID=933388 RepID=S7Z612_PENO1|nr:hypothetical protein PDE_00896 [Penicillium oxalicum 114-2]
MSQRLEPFGTDRGFSLTAFVDQENGTVWVKAKRYCEFAKTSSYKNTDVQLSITSPHLPRRVNMYRHTSEEDGHTKHHHRARPWSSSRRWQVGRVQALSLSVFIPTVTSLADSPTQPVTPEDQQALKVQSCILHLAPASDLQSLPRLLMCDRALGAYFGMAGVIYGHGLQCCPSAFPSRKTAPELLRLLRD